MYTFENIVGHNDIKIRLQQSIKKARVSHAYVFVGEKGAGKKTIAYTFAKTLQCINQQENPCSSCISCKTFETLNHPDIIYFTPEKATIGTEDVRDIIKEINLRPNGDYKKIIIIDKCHKLTIAAQNTILKTLEEPTSYSIIIFITESINNFLDTILSRVVVMRLGPVQDEYALSYISNKYQIDDQLASFYVAYARGNIGLLDKLIKDENFINLRKSAINFLIELDEKAINDVFLSYKFIEEHKNLQNDLFDIMQIFLRDCIVLKNNGEVLQKDIKNIIASYIKDIDTSTLIKKFEIVMFARNMLNYNTNFQMTIEIMLLRLRAA